MIAMLLVMLAGGVSALLYTLARQWIDAVLALVAAAALAALLGSFSLPGAGQAEVRIDPDAAAIDIASARSVAIDGDGMSAARWRDLPARALRWKRPASEVLHLEFPRRIALGSTFTLSARRGAASGWRLQLLAENGQLMAESSGQGATQSLQWLPPAAETMLLTARLVDAGGKVFARGPLPLQVSAPAALRVLGRFSAPSFDVGALNTLLTRSHALIDWEVALGQGVVRHDLPRAPLGRPDLVVTDARWLEQAGDAERAALMQNVDAGAALLRMDEMAGQHREAIANPRAFAQAWQAAIDRAGVRQRARVVWQPTEAMPLAGQRLEVCALGAEGEVLFPQLGQRMTWQRRADRADAACVAVWPRTPGWLEVSSGGAAAKVYVYGRADWPLWQASLRRDATAAYAARRLEPAAPATTPLPAWPFAALFALAMLLLWWREQR